MKAGLGPRHRSFGLRKIFKSKKHKYVDRQQEDAFIHQLEDNQTDKEENETGLEGKEKLIDVPNKVTEIPFLIEAIKFLGLREAPISIRIYEIAFADIFVVFALGTVLIICHAVILYVFMEKTRKISEKRSVTILLSAGQTLYGMVFLPLSTLLTYRAFDLVLSQIGFNFVLSIKTITMQHQIMAALSIVFIFQATIRVNGYLVHFFSGGAHMAIRQPLDFLCKTLIFSKKNKIK